jgi:hypothetical protein
MKRKRRLTVFDLANLPVIPVVEKVPGYRPTTLQSVQEEMALEEVQRRARVRDNPEQKKLVRLFWMRDFHILEQDSIETPGAYDELYLPKDENPDADECMKTFRLFLGGLTARTGFILNGDGERRLGKYAAIQTMKGGVAITPETLDVMFDRLRDLGVFEINAELRYKPELKTYVAPQEQQERAPKVKISDQLESLNLHLEPDRRLAQKLAEDHYLSVEVNPIFHEFIGFMRKTYNVKPTEADLRFICDLFVRNNWSFLDRRNWDRARRIMTEQEPRWADALSDDEKLSRRMESLSLGSIGFHERQELLQQSRRLRQS